MVDNCVYKLIIQEPQLVLRAEGTVGGAPVAHTHTESEITDLAHVTDPDAHIAAAAPHSGHVAKADDLKAFVLVDKFGDGDLEVGDNAAPRDIEIPFDCTIVEVRMKVRAAPTGAALQVSLAGSGAGDETMEDIVLQANGEIAIGAKYGDTTTIQNAARLKGSILRPNIDQIGSTIAGQGLTMTVIGLRT